MCLMADLTAPQPLCPRTRMRSTFSSATAYSMLPFTVTPAPSTTLPVSRTTKMSPTPTSKGISSATRESAQLTITASGNCQCARVRNFPGLRPGPERSSDHKAVVADEQLTQRLVRVHRARDWFLWRRRRQPGEFSFEQQIRLLACRAGSAMVSLRRHSEYYTHGFGQLHRLFQRSGNQQLRTSGVARYRPWYFKTAPARGIPL
jgi:hypothetical protein